jgi:leucyl aminopeptidase
VFTNREKLASRLVAAGAASGERVWNFPLDEDFETDLTSTVADTIQCSVEGKGDHILAARFLKRFIGDANPWVHVDLSSATRHGGLAHVGTEITGFGVRLTLEMLLTQRLYAAAR